MASKVQRSKGDIKWALFLPVFYLATLALDYFLSRRQARTGVEGGNKAAENAQRNTHLIGRACWYWKANCLICVFAALTAVAAGVAVLCFYEEEYKSIAVFSLIISVIFGSRSAWMKCVSNRGCKVTNNPDDYSLERTTLLAWGFLFFFTFVDVAPEKVTGAITTLILLTPIFTIFGSSWGKLKAAKPNGDKVAWPCQWGKSK